MHVPSIGSVILAGTGYEMFYQITLTALLQCPVIVGCGYHCNPTGVGQRRHLEVEEMTFSTSHVLVQPAWWSNVFCDSIWERGCPVCFPWPCTLAYRLIESDQKKNWPDSRKYTLHTFQLLFEPEIHFHLCMLNAILFNSIKHKRELQWIKLQLWPHKNSVNRDKNKLSYGCLGCTSAMTPNWEACWNIANQR